MSGATETVGSGIGGWLGYVGSTIGAIPGQYRAELRRKRGRTLGLTLLVIAFILYPVIGHYVLGPFSQSTFPLPYPDDTVATFMMIFAIMAIGLNIVAGFAGLLDLGYVAFYAIGAYCAAFLASPHFGSLGINLGLRTWHEGPFPTAESGRYFDKQGRVHGRVSCDLRSELGLMLNVPLPLALDR